jgi:hypothetical protein
MCSFLSRTSVTGRPLAEALGARACGFLVSTWPLHSCVRVINFSSLVLAARARCGFKVFPKMLPLDASVVKMVIKRAFFYFLFSSFIALLV